MKKIHPIKKAARIAGFLYLLQIPLGVFGILYIPKALVVVGNAEKTVANILANEFVFRLSIVSAILCALLTVATATYIFEVLKPVHQRLAKWILVFTLMAAPITMLNELNYIAVLLILKHPQYAASFTADQLNSIVSFWLDLHRHGLQLTGIFFGLWLLPMGYLVFRSGYIPKMIGVLLMVTCMGYLVDFALFFMNSNIPVTVSEYTWPGEVLMLLWLLIKGVDLQKFERLHPNYVLALARHSFPDPAK